MPHTIRVAIFLILVLAVVGSAAIIQTCLSSDPRGALPSPEAVAQSTADQAAPATAPAPSLSTEAEWVEPKPDPTQPLGDMQPLQGKKSLPPPIESAPGTPQGAGTGQTSSGAAPLPLTPSPALAPAEPRTFAPSPVAPPMGVASAGSAAQSGGDDIVYVTSNGSHYHRANCSHLKHGAIPMKRRDAQARYQPCPVCNP